MAVCNWCDQEMTGKEPVACVTPTYEIEGQTYQRLPYLPDYGPPDQKCHDCHTPPGGLHHPGCDDERCPNCGGQAISCSCDEPANG